MLALDRATHGQLNFIELRCLYLVGNFARSILDVVSPITDNSDAVDIRLALLPAIAESF